MSREWHFQPPQDLNRRSTASVSDGDFQWFLEGELLDNPLTPHRRRTMDRLVQAGRSNLFAVRNTEQSGSTLSAQRSYGGLGQRRFDSIQGPGTELPDISFLGLRGTESRQTGNSMALPTPPSTGRLTLPPGGAPRQPGSHMSGHVESNPGPSLQRPACQKSNWRLADRDMFGNRSYRDPLTMNTMELPLPPIELQDLNLDEPLPRRLTSYAFDSREQEIAPRSSPGPGPGSSSPAMQANKRRQRNRMSPPRLLSNQPTRMPPLCQHPQDRRPSYIDLPHTPPIVQGIRLVNPRQALPDKFKCIFQYELLNAVQSKCFEAAYGSNDNLVVSAPTGSGKTAILELAICKLAGDRGTQNYKIVYQAPTKALCSERARDWERKFGALGMKCAELTGDTSHAEMRRVGQATIIVTTPEKWDSVTRKWQDHGKLLELVELFLIDEVHILKDVRGATLEAVVSRMKSNSSNVRFVALSATVPNSEDIARWLGRDHTNPQLPARRETFGEEFRPVRLQKIVYGYDGNGNEFIFDRFLDDKLPMVISRHASQKPILVFCFTRKSCESTARKLAEYWSGMAGDGKPWLCPSKRIPVINSALQETLPFGVAFHHAGLEAQDRIAVEQNFLNGELNVICCTSTLAVGINLPCHTVVLKGTAGYSDDKLQEYSDLEVMQMLGRAGRRQFDDSAVAIILTRNAHKTRYERMVSGQEILESTLHLNLIEHLNSEIGLGAIRDLRSAKAWLGGTFLSVRLRKNPGHYNLARSVSFSGDIDDMLEEICERDIRLLQRAKLVTNGDSFGPTDYGRAMSRYMIEFSTMQLVLEIPRGPNMETLITALSKAAEFRDFRMKPAERSVFRQLNEDNMVLYPIKETVLHTWHKISLTIQVNLGGVPFPEPIAAWLKRQFMMEKKLIFERLQRLSRCVIECKGFDCDGIGTRVALELARSISADAWEGRPTQLTQVPSIGPAGMRKLVSRGVRTVLQLAECSYTDVERMMSRNPPFGKKLVDSLELFPRLAFDVCVTGENKSSSRDAPFPTINIKVALRHLNRVTPTWLGKSPPVTFHVESARDCGTLLFFWRGRLNRIDQEGTLELQFPIQVRTFQDYFNCYFSCEEIVGTTVSKALKHDLPEDAFGRRALPPSQVRTSSKNNRIVYEIMDEDDIDDEVMLQAANNVEALPSAGPRSIPGLSSRDYLFSELDDVLEVVTPERDRDKQQQDTVSRVQGTESEPVPVKLPNGKWKCNHVCGGNGLTKTGRTCTHPCCKDGLDKPRKLKSTRQKSGKRKVPYEDLDDEDFMEGLPDLLHLEANGSQSQADKRKHSIVGRDQDVQDSHHAQKIRELGQLAHLPLKKQKTRHWSDETIECIDLSHIDDHLPEAADGIQVPNNYNTDLLQPPGQPMENYPCASSVGHEDLLHQVQPQLSDTGMTTGAHQPGPSIGSQEQEAQVAALAKFLLEEAGPDSSAVSFKSGAHDDALFPGIYGAFGSKEETLKAVTSDTSPLKGKSLSVMNQLGAPSQGMFASSEGSVATAATQVPYEHSVSFLPFTTDAMGNTVQGQEQGPGNGSIVDLIHPSLLKSGINDNIDEAGDTSMSMVDQQLWREFSPGVKDFLKNFCDIE